MASTYVNDLRLNEMATGDASGSWGTVTNTNLELIGEAFSYGTETIGDADSTLTIADGAADAARSFYLKITSSVDLTTTRIVTLGPNTVSKVWMIENATTGSQVITIKQGSGATINVPNGQVKMISTDGAGSGGAVLDLLVDVDLTGTTTLVNLDVSGAVDIAGDLTLSAGGDGALRFTAASSVKVLDNNAAALVFEEADNAYMTFVTTDGSEAVKFDKALDINAATQIDATVTVGVDDTGYDVKFFGATAGKYMLWDESADTLEVSGTVVAAAGTALLPSITTTGDLNTGMWFPAADTIAFSEGGVEALRIDSSGSVGIGVVPDAWSGTGAAIQLEGTGHLATANQYAYIGSNYYYNDGWKYTTSSTAAQYRQDSGTHQWLTAASGSADAAITWSESMRIDSSGGLITTPAAGGHAVFNEGGVDADFRVESDTNANMLFVDAGVSAVGIGTATQYDGTALVSPLTISSLSGGSVLETFRGSASLFQLTMSTTGISSWNTSGSAAAHSFRTGTTVGTTSIKMYLGDTGYLTTTPEAGGHAVFNEDGVDADFRVESDANDHMLFVDGGNNRVSINSNSTSYDSAAPLHIGNNSTYSYGPNIQGAVNRTYVHYIGAGGGSGNNVYIHGYQVDNPAGGNYLRVASGLAGNTVSGVQQSQDGMIYVYDTGKTTGDADYTPTVQHRIDLNSGGSVVFNDQGLDLDFRVESDNNANMLFLDASVDRISMGTGDSADGTLTLRSTNNNFAMVQESAATIPSGGIRARMFEGTYAINGNSSNSVLSIPIFSQGGLWVQYQVELSVVTGEYNSNSYAKGGSCIFSFTSLTTLDALVEQQVTGNISSVTLDSANMEVDINFSSAYTAGQSGWEGVLVHERHKGETNNGYY
jgi:hypothetical protein